MIHPHLDDYHPPMPALEIRLGYPEEPLRLGPIVAIVDTGADGTLVPQTWLDEISAPLVDEVRLRSHWGEWRTARVFTVDLGIGDLRLPGVEVVGDELSDEVILGRNVLNRLKLLLDGPRSCTEMFDS
jgi:predicted aspartyl protease